MAWKHAQRSGITGKAWSASLNQAQRTAVRTIRGPSRDAGWSVLMQPTVGPARKLELIHRPTAGSERRWRIEMDGSFEEITPQDRGVTAGRMRDHMPIRGQRTA